MAGVPLRTSSSYSDECPELCSSESESEDNTETPEEANTARIRSRRKSKRIEDSFPVETGEQTPLVEMPVYDE